MEKNAQIEPRRHVLDVVQVVAHLLGFFLEAVGVALPNLRPPGESRSYGGPKRVVRDFFCEQLEVRLWMRARADEVHLAAEDVDQLRQLVEAKAAQPLANPCDPVAVVAHPLRGRSVSRAHGPKLEQLQAPSAQADSIVDEKDWTRRVEFDGQHDERQQRREHDDGGQ